VSDETVRLGAVWRPAVEKHLLALSPDDRYGRFASALSDAAVAAYAGRIDFARDLCLAIVEADGRLSGVIHLAVHGQVAELGASVLPGWRRQGRARRLFAAALDAAAALGIREVHLATGHPAARHICGGLGYLLREGAAYPRLRVVLARGGAERGR
jgi:GNAT superfamily N-acetyltransferase